ncbi:MAG: carboxyl transferase domain-containing protein [Acidimicrobiales bacterium]
MTIEQILVANRGEIAIRIARTTHDLGRRVVMVHGTDDSGAAHLAHGDGVVALPGHGVSALLDIDAVVSAAVSSDCDAVHPGYGLLSENAELARRCVDAGLTFIGPTPETLDAFGDKAATRDLADHLGVPVTRGGADDVERLAAALLADGPVVIKAVAGGGGRGMRIVHEESALADAIERCRSEAAAAFGRADVLVEAYVRRARHIEVQVVGDGTGAVAHLGDRDCTLQRRHQKLVEIAPAPALDDEVRHTLLDAAVRITAEVRYRGVGTVEFLVDRDRTGADAVSFLEVNPRLQVEHTVTEEVTGLDLVAVQIHLADGRSLADLGLDVAPTIRGSAVQARVNAERVAPDGTSRPADGTVTRIELPSGPGVRVDHALGAGVTVNPSFDSLVAKVVAHGPDLDVAVRRVGRALGELVVEGVDTNRSFLAALVGHPDVVAGATSTDFVDTRTTELDFDAADEAVAPSVEQGAVVAPLVGTVVAVDVSAGDEVPRGAQLVVIESMKMEHVVTATTATTVVSVAVGPGDTVAEGQVLLTTTGGEIDDSRIVEHEIDLEAPRADLDAVVERHAIGLDPARPEAVAKRHGTGHRTARENVDDLCDAGSFIEYGPLVIAAQRRRRELQELIERTPADGLVGGVGTVNGALFGADASRCVVASYDYMVLAGTQGHHNHMKKDRLFEIAERLRLPVVLFAEGGGGRPGDTDVSGVSGLDTMAFHLFGRLSGTVPLVGIAAGRCFAGNAALLGTCDVIIATQSATIGMGGPAMIEGGGLGVVTPDEIGPLSIQVPNGVVDVAVADEAEAVAVARRYLSYFQGPVEEWDCADQRILRHLVPEIRTRVYDVRSVIEALADTGSVLELREHFGVGILTALVRIEGRPYGLVANNPAHLGGAIDRDAADKCARFMQLCDAFGLPIVALCDTPGFMVGTDSERQATVRHFARLFVTGANLDVPIGTIILRKAYGLGAQAMAGGSFKTPVFTVAWPMGELGGMGLEGAVKLAYRRELDAVEDATEREALFDEMVARSYERGKAANAASVFEIDDVIDPADTRRWITALLVAPDHPAGAPPRRPFVDTW